MARNGGGHFSGTRRSWSARKGSSCVVQPPCDIEQGRAWHGEEPGALLRAGHETSVFRAARRRAVVGASHALPPVIAMSDLLLTMPKRMARIAYARACAFTGVRGGLAAMALEYASEVDPLSRPDEIAKSFEPDLSKLTDPG